MRGISTMRIIDALQMERRRLLGELEKVDKAIRALGGTTFGGRRGRPVLSIEARAKIAAAQRARWAKVKSVKK
jgi:hypothetical protein